MDEIIIDEKKYISTKRAAKATGYAKDYVGQLCREGRVPARLVGRSWYVLESALADHRFGNEESAEPVVSKAEKVEKEEKRSEYPKYQADEIESIDTLASASVRVEAQAEKPERETIKEAWEAWFDRIAKATTQQPREEVVEETPEVEVHISKEESVVIHAVLEKEEKGSEEVEVEEEGSKSEQVPVHITHRKAVGAVRGMRPPRVMVASPVSSILISAKIGSGLLSLFFLVVLALSTGFFDSNLISGGRDSSLAGISIYKK
jgi:hypothetical protein